MSCRRVRKRLSEYLDARLSLKRGRVVEGHLERCPACRGEMAHLAEVKWRLAEAGAKLCDAGFWERFYSALRHETRRPERGEPGSEAKAGAVTPFGRQEVAY